MRAHFTLAFWMCLLQLGPVAFAQSDIPNPGPRSDDQAQFLYEEGDQAFTQKNYSLAIKDFENFVNRYPSDERVQGAYLRLLESLFAEKKFGDLLKYGREFLRLKTLKEPANRVRAYLAESHLNLRHYLEARTGAQDLLKNEPNTRQKALGYSVQFQSLLEEKQYGDAHEPLETLGRLLDKDPLEPFTKMVPEFKMTLAMRECTISHLLKNKDFNEEELTDYFTQKNLCFKAALPPAVLGVGPAILNEWCEDFTYLNHELQKLRIDPFLKEKLQGELKSTLEFAKTLSTDLGKCYESYKPPAKIKKHHRKRRVHSP